MFRSAAVFRFVLIALFLFAYQTTTIHSKHHHLEEFGGCQVCKASKSLGTSHHETLFSLQSESIAVEVSEIEEKKIIQASYDLTQTPEQETASYEGMIALSVPTLPLGFDPHAPPYTFS
ncbi:hypothetical protein [Sulfurovum mangrovi]|uniref:hypothetical protein n=1 Tax=Sulfurovum mangrovi TaxID=2893889 RepID=UPI001E3B427C|nr:hypothetical protein [Sulfurovum mangrovi]UFH59746.1 hypothetical protein LN246_02560 [Sulfurovum mangrovi]UFH60547.1 hypothetical protein LN246_13125 [Sulfurovum mangrovi]